MLHFWDPATKQITLRAVTSSGQSWQAIVRKKNENTWQWKLEGSLLDGTKQLGTGTITFGDDSYVVEGAGTLGNEKLPPLRDEYERVAP